MLACRGEMAWLVLDDRPGTGRGKLRRMMKTAPGLMAAALLFWGGQTGLLLWGLVLGLIIEAPRWIRMRWDLGSDDFRRLWNVTVLLFLGAGLYLFSAHEGWGAVSQMVQDPRHAAGPLRQTSQGLLHLLQWLPILFFPFVLAHAFSRANWLPWEALSPLLHARRKRWGDRLPAAASRGFHPTYPYLVVVLFSASADFRYPTLFFPGLAFLVGWALWPYRSRRFAWSSWALVLGLAVSVAFVGQRGLLLLFQQFERWEARWINQLAQGEVDPRGVRTDLGAIRRGKGSSRIVLRVFAPNGNPPALLREAAFTHFRSPYWGVGHLSFEAVRPAADDTTWVLSAPTAPRHPVQIWRYSRAGAMGLPLPLGTFEVRDLPVEVLETNRLASARIQGGARLVSYTAWHGAGSGFASTPEAEDLDLAHLTASDSAAVRRAAAELGLFGLDPHEVLERLATYFLTHFEYALESAPDAGGGEARRQALGRFLFESRKGHCEYYATASTLLLRAGGVPARYVIGHSVQEKQGDTFVVRGRHAHAWSEAHVDGRWITVDNTPANWSELETPRRSAWEPVYDRLSALWLTFSQWRQGESSWRAYIFAAGIALLSFMGWRELRGGRWRRAQRPGTQTAAAFAGPGLDSDFYRVLKVLERRMTPRLPSTPLRPWLHSLPLPDQAGRDRLLGMLELHYRLRFDPDGLPAQERAALKADSERWLSSAAARSTRLP
jgi:protein-glutamine gamma-glutamyltransferase